VSRSDLLKSRLDRFARAVASLEKGDSKSLHRARVSSRRLRELVPALQLKADVAKKLSRRLRKVTKRLGAVRELDVLLELVDELNVSRPIHQAALRRTRAGVTKDRNAARKHQLGNSRVGSLRRITKKLDRVLADLRDSEKLPAARRGPGERSLVWAIDARIANRATQLRNTVGDAGAVYLPERLHAVRIAVKKLRYALELRAEATGDGQKTALRGLERVQTLLGRMHDLQVLIDRVREVQASLTPPSLAVWREMDGLVLALDEMCRRIHARFVREREAVDALAVKAGAATANAASAHERQVG
jgi:CHAD domain-containing protein